MPSNIIDDKNFGKGCNNLLISSFAFLMSCLFMILLIIGNSTIKDKRPVFVLLIVSLVLILFIISHSFTSIKKKHISMKKFIKNFYKNIVYILGLFLVIFFAGTYIILLVIYLFAGLGFY